ncbi:MAG: phenylacetic acid degradation protein PaaN [Chitinophagales bacterium]
MSLFEKHKELLDRAVQAVRERTFYAAYPEIPKAYPEDATANGLEAFKNYQNRNFPLLLQKNSSQWQGEEVSPYTQESLAVKYPIYSSEELMESASRAFKLWRTISVQERTGLLIESLEKMKSHFFDIAFATQHTTGQSWIMSFQASGPHAADRALEAIAMGYDELTKFPSEVIWEKPMGKFSVKLDKTFIPVPKGIGLVIGCSTFPVWNSLPGLYADLITGNVAIVKPHPKAILPIAICVAALQHVLKENGFDPNIVQLAADTSSNPITKELAKHPGVKLIDYTGSTPFGNWIESLPEKISFTEKAGVNSVIIDSVKDMDAALQNLAFSVSLYSGQMCTAPQNFFIPERVKAGETEMTFDEVVAKMKDALSSLVNNPKMGAGVLGAIQNEKTLERTQAAAALATEVLGSSAVKNEEFPGSRTVSPVLIETNGSDTKTFETELFGPIAIAIKTKSTDESIKLAKELAEQHGAITCAAYSTDENVMKKIAGEMNEVFVPVTFNLTGPIWVNQHAAFSDLHVTGGNPSGNASLTDAAFIVKRFVWVGNRKMM